MLAGELRSLWTTVTFNQFHDILPGSAINEANKEAVARYTEVLRQSTAMHANAFRKMADEVKFQSGIGQPVVAFHFQPKTRKVIVEANVYSHEAPVSVNPVSWADFYGSRNVRLSENGNASTVLVRDASGKSYPAQKWVDLTDGNPDLYLNLGKFNISYALYPHEGDWTNGVWAEGDDFNVPVYAAEPPSLALAKNHATRPEEASLISLDQKSVMLSGLKQAEDGKELIVRIAEIEGKETTVTVQLPVGIQSAQRLNLAELPLEAEKPVIKGKSLQVKVKAHEIVTLGILPVK